MQHSRLPQILAALVLAFAADIAAHAQVAKPVVPLTVSADHPDALYHRGETVTFKIMAAADSPVAQDAEVEWTISKDGVPPVKSGKIKLAAGSANVTAQLDEPGFLQCKATATVAEKPVAAMAGAGFDPTQIKPSLPVPEDFDAFWKDQKAKLAAVPMKAKMTLVEQPQKNVEAFDVQVDAIGAPASGYFARPLNAKPKSLPVILFVQGAGVRGGNLSGPVSWAGNGMLAMDINAHGIANGKPDAFYKELTDGALRDYRAIGRESRETCYFLGMFLRELRALDFLCSQPEWDGKTVIVDGSSQGGFQAFAGGALDERVTFFAAGVPAGSDHSGMVVGRVAGWPKIVPLAGGKPDPKVLEAARYFDNVNFAAKTKAKGAIVTVGFIDVVCPPTTVYAAYDALPIADKKIYNDIPSGHTNSPGASAAMTEAVRAHVKAMQGPAR